MSMSKFMNNSLKLIKSNKYIINSKWSPIISQFKAKNEKFNKTKISFLLVLSGSCLLTYYYVKTNDDQESIDNKELSFNFMKKMFYDNISLLNPFSFIKSTPLLAKEQQNDVTKKKYLLKFSIYILNLIFN